MTLTAEGLLIGMLDADNQPSGSYIIIGPTGSSIYNGDGDLVASYGGTVQVGQTSKSHVVITDSGVEIRNGSNKVLANFTSNGIQLNDSTGVTIAEFGTNTIAIGKSTSATITFCGGKAVISLDGTTLRITGGNSVEAIGISNTYNNRYRSEVVCEAKNNSPKASIQLLNANRVITSILLSTDGVNINVPPQKALTVSKDNGTGHEVVTVNDIVMYGDIVFRPSSGEATRITCSTNPNIPNGYTLIGLSEIKTNYTIYWGLDYLNVNPSNNSIDFQIGSKDGTAKPKPGEIYCRWFAIRTSGIKYDGETTIDM